MISNVMTPFFNGKIIFTNVLLVFNDIRRVEKRRCQNYGYVRQVHYLRTTIFFCNLAPDEDQRNKKVLHRYFHPNASEGLVKDFFPQDLITTSQLFHYGQFSKGCRKIQELNSQRGHVIPKFCKAYVQLLKQLVIIKD